MCDTFKEWVLQVDGISSGPSDYDNCSILVYDGELHISAQPISVDKPLPLNFCPICGEALIVRGQ